MERATAALWKSRFMAWWEGYEWTPAMRPDAPDSAPHEEPTDPVQATENEPTTGKKPGMRRDNRPLWNPGRIEVAERCWGEGFNSPGGLEHVLYLIKPAGILPQHSVLDLSAGLGGSTRAIAQEFNGWVTGFEASPLLADIAMERTVKAGLVKNAPVSAYDPENFKYPKKVDCIFAKELFFTIANKTQLFDGIYASLKGPGHIVFTDYVLEPSAKPNKALAKWATVEPLEPYVMQVPRVVAELKHRKLDVRIHEDLTDTYLHLIKVGLQNLSEHMATVSMDTETKNTVMDEIELWVHRVAAFDAGLRVYRFHAMRH